MKSYIDTENGYIVIEEELRAEYEENKEQIALDSNAQTFEEWIENCTNKNGFLEEAPKCDWCEEYFEESELKNTDLGKLCDRCIAAIRSRGESITIILED